MCDRVIVNIFSVDYYSMLVFFSRLINFYAIICLKLLIFVNIVYIKQIMFVHGLQNSQPVSDIPLL